MLSDSDLQKLLRFNDNDLEANRLGQFSENQIAQMENNFENLRIFGTVFGLSFALIGLWLILSPQQYLMGGAFVVLGLLLVAIVWLGKHRPLQEATIQKVSTRLAKKMDESSETSDYYLILDGIEIQVSQKIYEALSEGDAYKFYYYHSPKHGLFGGVSQLISAENQKRED